MEFFFRRNRSRAAATFVFLLQLEFVWWLNIKKQLQETEAFDYKEVERAKSRVLREINEFYWMEQDKLIFGTLL